MALKLDRRCNICKLIEAGDDALLKRLYKSSHFKGTKGESLKAIHRDYHDKFEYPNMWRHLKNHQFLTEDDAKRAGVSVQDANAAKKLVKDAVVTHSEVRELILKKGKAGIASGRIKLKASDVRAAAKDAADIEERQKDRQVQVMDMILKVASGEVVSGLFGAGSNSEQTRTVIDSTA